VKHTPRPWKIVDDGGWLWIYGNVEDGTGPLAEVDRLSNAYLIAAAPDLLEACELLVRSHEVCGGDTSDAAGLNYLNMATEQARAAIAKAKGEET
jgi:hypothetical protein